MLYTDRIWAFLILCCVYSNSLRQPKRVHLPQGIQHYTHTPRSVCQYTLYSYMPGVKSFWDDPQNTWLHSMQHALGTVKPPGRIEPRQFPQTAVSSYSSMVYELRLANRAECADCHEILININVIIIFSRHLTDFNRTKMSSGQNLGMWWKPITRVKLIFCWNIQTHGEILNFTSPS